MRTFAVGSVALLAAVAIGSASAEAATRRGHGHGRRAVVAVRGFYGPYFGPYPAFYGWSPFAFGYGYGPYYGYGYGYAPYHGPYRYDDSASARVQVTPKQTEVYVDGYLAGVADNFDGTFQRLHVRPGGHEITLYLDGHRSVTERLYFSTGKTQKIKMAMVPLAPGEAPAPRPAAPRRSPRSGN
jgi:hypothetical protein